jgi:uncharacterized protein (TIGR02391 family)
MQVTMANASLSPTTLVRVYEVLSKIRVVVLDNWTKLSETNEVGPPEVQQALSAYYDQLRNLWPEILHQSNLSRHMHFNQKTDYWDIVNLDLPAIEAKISQIVKNDNENVVYGFESLLHPIITQKALPLHAGTHYRQCIFEAYATVFSLLRERSKLDLDGDNLVGKALSLNSPILAFGNLNTESGRTVQKGMIQILQGVYQAFRNIAAHPHNLAASQTAAAQHMVFASVLVRRIEAAKKVI